VIQWNKYEKRKVSDIVYTKQYGNFGETKWLKKDGFKVSFWPVLQLSLNPSVMLLKTG